MDTAILDERPATVAPRHTHRDLAVGYYAAGFTRWCYLARPDDRTATAHRLADCLTPGYFRDAADMMAPGDMIDVIAHDGSAIVSVVEVTNRPDFVRVVVMARTPAGEVP